MLIYLSIVIIDTVVKIVKFLLNGEGNKFLSYIGLLLRFLLPFSFPFVPLLILPLSFFCAPTVFCVVPELAAISAFVHIILAAL
jgi:hypothetical protein